MKSLNNWDKNIGFEKISSQPTSTINSLIRLLNYLELDIVPDEYKREFVYSKLLEDIVQLTKKILNEKGNWRM